MVLMVLSQFQTFQAIQHGGRISQRPPRWTSMVRSMRMSLQMPGRRAAGWIWISTNTREIGDKRANKTRIKQTGWCQWCETQQKKRDPNYWGCEAMLWTLKFQSGFPGALAFRIVTWTLLSLEFLFQSFRRAWSQWVFSFPRTFSRQVPSRENLCRSPLECL